MVKRTRRNLSDPRIKKIVKAQTYNGKTAVKKPHHQRSAHGSNGKSMKVLFFAAIFAVLGFAIYTNWTAVYKFVDQTLPGNLSLSQNETATPESLTPTLSQMQPAQKQSEITQGDNSESNNNSQSADLESSSAENSPDNTDNIIESAEETAPLQPVIRKIQVEVLNGCGVKGLAEKFTNYLRQENIDVVSRGNYKNFKVKQTSIIDRINDDTKSSEIAAALGVKTGQVIVKKNESLQLDATIILGADYKKLKPFTN